MATEGAGGLSTAAIEAAIDHWATHRHEQIVRDVEARAELAALQAAATETNALRAALLDVGCAASRVAVLIPRVRRADYDEAWARLDGALVAALALYDGGPGAAGVRDETTALAVIRAELATPLAEATKWHYSWREAVGDGQPRLTVTIGALQRIADALDAPRAGGAEEVADGDDAG